MLVYVKRLVAGGPADQVRCITPGDTLILIDGEDVYGWGLDVLRTRIPGPMGTSVRPSRAGVLVAFSLLTLSARTCEGISLDSTGLKVTWLPPE